MNSPNFRHLIAAGAAILSLTTTALVLAPAYAQLGGTVHDPRNYAQNILTAARTLEQINNQIRQLQNQATRSEEHTSELQSLMRISYAVFCLKKKNKKKSTATTNKNKTQIEQTISDITIRNIKMTRKT